MKQAQFEQQYGPLWQQLDEILTVLERRHGGEKDKDRLREFNRCYRQVCSHYALAGTRHYSPRLIASLHDLVLRGHHYLYTDRRFLLWQVVRFIVHDFPVTLRQHAGLFWLSTALLYVPGMIMGLICYVYPDMIYTLLDYGSVADYEFMYRPENRHLGENRDQGTDLSMFGFYIFNNIGVGFRTFAGGLLAGTGTLFLMIFNGLHIGAVAGHLTLVGLGETFWSFVSGHGAFELTAICISGMAGLRLGIALIATGRYRRLDALKAAARPALTLVMGAALMLVVAAFIEAFWSSMGVIPATVKFYVAAMLWFIVVCYLSLAGRRYGHQ